MLHSSLMDQLTQMLFNHYMLVLVIAAVTSAALAIYIWKHRSAPGATAPLTYDTIIESMSDSVIVLDAQNHIVDLNAAAQQIIKQTPSELRGQPVARALSWWPDLAERYRDMVKTRIVSALYEGEAQRNYDLYISPIHDRHRHTIGRLVVLHDTTEQLKAEAERLKVMGQVARNIAHDIRNPLQAIQNAAYLLRNAEGEQRRKMADLIDRNIVAADRIVQNMMDFSSAPPLKLREEDVNRLLRETISQAALPEGVKLSTNYGEVPQVKVDGRQLSRVFENLVTNAIQAMPEGGELHISTERREDSIEIKVKDTGVGIPKENLGKVFEPFFTTKAKGTGLGLVNAKRVVEDHEGTITVKSREGKGTTVTIQLPINQPAEQHT